MSSLLITFIAGAFFLVGALVPLFWKNSKNLINFSVGMSFIVLIFLVIMDILPESLELITENKILGIGGGILIGLGSLMLIDKFVPHHHDSTKNCDNHHNHLVHIGVITSVALIIHNLVEGAGIYSIATSDTKTGLLYAFGVALHNIPFGIKVTAMLKEENKPIKMWTYITLLTFSTLLGGLIVFAFKDLLTDFVLGSLLSITVGMIIYLIFFELLILIKESFNKYTIFGIIIGIALMLIGLVI